MGTKRKLKISIFLPEMIANLKFQWKLVYCVGTDGYLWEPKKTEKFHFSARYDCKLKISVEVGILCGY